MALFPKLEEFVSNLHLDSLTEERKLTLQPLVDFVQQNVNEEVRINFICTHNSRRSHLSQIWAQALAHHFGLKNVQCYSGGTEVTALYPMVAETLRSTGFEVQPLSEGNNPVYYIKYSDSTHPVIGFSKKLDHGFNPGSGFAAVMTCDSANEACPFVPGAKKRIPITYEDPKVFDDTPQQAEKYNERSRQIASEMYYVFSLIQ
ncbi:protein-tyrosine-phosphatase [Flagellimonas taeanensis]|uniref:arsenate-mycothiol transferase ArsC n=1 Tax=Flavobacteriaceae TaxID=49546 RepID=UPI000E6834D8|nr:MULTISPECIES: protein-tyrosine-phosphatase [Allomuricauda]MDC6386252.1 protein-tyrosine-phosphatase [Muricauda sp. SK9]RIV48072.1 protein-tyrosine-phosphatase [Allomuricauda taeanensis]